MNQDWLINEIHALCVWASYYQPGFKAIADALDGPGTPDERLRNLLKHSQVGGRAHTLRPDLFSSSLCLEMFEWLSERDPTAFRINMEQTRASVIADYLERTYGSHRYPTKGRLPSGVEYVEGGIYVCDYPLCGRLCTVTHDGREFFFTHPYYRRSVQREHPVLPRLMVNDGSNGLVLSCDLCSAINVEYLTAHLDVDGKRVFIGLCNQCALDALAKRGNVIYQRYLSHEPDARAADRAEDMRRVRALHRLILDTMDHNLTKLVLYNARPMVLDHASAKMALLASGLGDMPGLVS
jgi:hypothetical protein